MGTTTLTRADCPACGHHAFNHNDGTCNVTASSSAEGVREYPGGCGCSAMPFDATCTTCGKPYVCGLGHDPHECLRCYGISKHAADAESFGPLIDALQARSIPVSDTDIANTGGNVMCLILPVTEDRTGPYVMWSDDAEYIGFGIYPASTHSGLFVSPEGDGDDRPEESYSWAYGDNAERAADLAMRALPEIVRWLTEDVTITSEQMSGGVFGDYVETSAAFDRLPVIEGAEIENFGGEA